METRQERSKEHPNTYMVQDRSNQEELTRLRIQDQMLTTRMGGVLPEQADPTRFHRVIDVGCGMGGWLIALAQSYPTINLLAGVDVSASMVKAARAQAEEEGISNRVEFHVMDALRMIEFPKNYFDLVNHRLNFSYLRKWNWPNLLQEYQRIARPGAVIRITEPNILAESNSEALSQLSDLALDAFWNAGHFFTPGREGVIGALPELFHQQGLSDVQTRIVNITYTADTETLPAFIDDNRLLFRTILPFLHKWTRVPFDYDRIYQQALAEMARPDFRAWFRLMTVWGTNTHADE